MAKGPETRNVFLAKHLNVEIGMNLRANRWPGADFWPKRVMKDLTLEYLISVSEVVVVGIDGGGLDDLFGFAVVGRHKETRDWLVWSHAWCHEGVLERRKSIADRLRDFQRAEELTIVDDELADISEIVGIVDEINQRGLLASVAVDPAGLGEMIEALAEIGITQEGGQLIGAPQGWAMMNAIKTAERKLAIYSTPYEPALGDVGVVNTRRFGPVGVIFAQDGIALWRADNGTGLLRPRRRDIIKVWALPFD